MRQRTRHSPEEETEEVADDLHGPSAGRIGEGLRKNAVSGYLHERRARAEDETNRSEDTSKLCKCEGDDVGY